MLKSKVIRAELSRQGAKSAARGERPPANPMNSPQNQPPSTGESIAEWKARRDAWQAGYDLQSETSRTARPPTTQGRDDELD